MQEENLKKVQRIDKEAVLRALKKAQGYKMVYESQIDELQLELTQINEQIKELEKLNAE